MSKLLSRRTVLRGIGATVAMPWLEAMSPRSAAAGTVRHPLRMAAIYTPHGTNMADWTPAAVGELPEVLPANLRPLAALRREFSVLSGMKIPHGLDGGALHSHAMAGFLTGVQMHPTEGPNIRAGASADQIASSRVGAATFLPSLQIGTFAVTRNIEPGVNPGYLNLSWRDASNPVLPATNPREVFDRLFSGNAVSPNRRARERSILDYVREEANSLQTNLGAHDRRKLDEYFAAIRDIEQRIQRVERMPAPRPPSNVQVADGDWSRWADRWEQQVRLQGDLMVLAFQADITRVCTFAFDIERSIRVYRELGITQDHHGVSHGDIRDLSRINTYHSTQLAYIFDRLKQTREGDGSLLDHCMIAYGSGMQNGGHGNGNLPILLAGRGNGTLNPGRHLRLAADTPLCNLWMSMLDRIDVRLESLGDGRGRLENL
ncbi:MAG: DUF1552 domain-containing protein [Planctomycetota bacterium]